MERHGPLPVVASGRGQAADPRPAQARSEALLPEPPTLFSSWSGPSAVSSRCHGRRWPPDGGVACGMLCRPLVVESEHYAFSPVPRVQGESRGGWGILSALCVLHRLTRGPGRNTQILGPRGNIFQSTPCPRLIENQSPPAPTSGPPIEGAPQPVFSIQTLDRSQTRGLRGGKGCPLASPPCSMGFSPVNQPAAPFQGPADRAAVFSTRLQGLDAARHGTAQSWAPRAREDPWRTDSVSPWGLEEWGAAC